MARVSLNDEILVRGRHLHLQTNTIEELSKIISTLFDSGRVIKKAEYTYNPDMPPDRLKVVVKSIHSKRIDVIQGLYLCLERIKSGVVENADRLRKDFLEWNLKEEAGVVLRYIEK